MTYLLDADAVIDRLVQHRAYALIVAATALVHGMTLVTSNTRDYSDIPSLRLLDTRSSQR